MNGGRGGEGLNISECQGQLSCKETLALTDFQGLEGPNSIKKSLLLNALSYRPKEVYSCSSGELMSKKIDREPARTRTWNLSLPIQP